MAFIVTILPNEPIILLRFDLPLEKHLGILRHVWTRCARLVDEHDGLLYRILDTRNLDIAYSDVLLILDDLRYDRPGSLSDPQIQSVAVGDSPILTLGLQKISEQCHIDIPIFDTLDAALTAIRAEITAQPG